MKNVVAYIRVSTDGQVGEDKYGLEAQKEEIEEYCRKNKFNIMKWYSDEGESGAKYRPGFDEIVYGEVGNPPVEAVVVAKSDRVARDINIYFYYQGALLRKGIELISITEDFGQFGVFANLLRAFTLQCAELERENINKRTSAGRIIKAGRGGYSGGRAPMGYRVQGGKLVVNEDEAKAVRRIFELRDNGMPLLTIVDTINKEGYKTRGGKEFVISTVQSIVKNRKTYQGYYHYGKSGEWVNGEHEPILGEEL